MPCGAHHHLKRLAAPTQWGLDKKGGKYAVRPLPGPHNKELSIPLKYVIARFLNVANTNKEVEYIASSRMIAVNGKEVTSPKFPVGIFDVITVKKTNQHFRIYLGANKKFKLHKIDSGEANIRISKVVSKYNNDSIPMTHTLDGYNFKYVDPSVEINDTVVIDIASNKVVSYVKLIAGKTAYVLRGGNAGRIGVIKYVNASITTKSTVSLMDPHEKVFTVPLKDVIVIGEDDKNLISFEKDDGIRLNAFEISNLKYAPKEKVEIEN